MSSSIRKEPRKPEGEEAAAAEGTPQIDKSTVMKSFFQAELERKDEEIERLKAENQRLRAKIFGGEDGPDMGEEVEAPAKAAPAPSPASNEAALGILVGALKEQLAAATADKERLAAEASDGKDRLLRSLAELDNVRRRTEKEKLDISKYAITEFAREVIGIGDNIQRAIDHVPAEAAASDSALKSFLEGVQMLDRELLSALDRHGVTRINPQGERFDPNRHQAVMEQEAPEVPAGTVVQVLQPGFTIAERVLRPAVVIVSKGGAKVPKPAEPAAAAPNAQTANEEAPAADPGASGEDTAASIPPDVDRGQEQA